MSRSKTTRGDIFAKIIPFLKKGGIVKSLNRKIVKRQNRGIADLINCKFVDCEATFMQFCLFAF
ncbi:hypothetical protein CEY12_03860 [Chryseobacterium sp. T16E-39]|nr:hypothetical protein CEY12_03860 [Chryseobacterium sp. T16E-39]